MQPLPQMQGITSSAQGKLFSTTEREALAQLDCAVSDTETTGLDRKRHGLTEIASIRAMRDAHGRPCLQLFQRFILPLRPEYRDYLNACAFAKAAGTALPPYDRTRYEYVIDPAALAITGSEILREKGLDGPITGLKVNGKKVKAEPFYTVMENFLAFTRDGKRDAYFNAPFDAPFIGKQIADIMAHDLARNEAYRTTDIAKSDALTSDEKRIVRELSAMPYEQLNVSEQAQITRLMRRFANVPESYTNPARWQCFMYGYMAAHGLGAENTLKAISKKLYPDIEEQTDTHSGVQDIMLTTKMGLTLPAAQDEIPHVANMRELYEQMLHKVDAAGTVIEGEAREHTNGKANEPPVHGDMVIQFSDAPEKLGPKAEAYWKFLIAYDEVTRANSRVSHHILRIDALHHRVVINAERANSLMLNFMKKQAFFFQMLDHPLIQSVLPYDSTGTVMDVTLHPSTSSAHQTIEHVNYRSLRANIDFLTAHADKAEAYLELMKRLHKEDARVGLVLFKPQADGSLDILVRGHARIFGDCVLNLPANIHLADAIPQLCRELKMQLNLGVIPNIAEFSHSKEEAEILGEDTDDVLDEADDIKTRETDNIAAVGTRKIARTDDPDAPDDAMQLTVASEVFQLLAHRLNMTSELMLKDGIRTSHGYLQVKHDAKNAAQPRYRITGNAEAFHDFVALDDQGLKGEKPNNILRDACWLLHRLQRLPGTSRLRMDGNMAILEQDDGVDVEALGLLHKLGIPFKAYDTQIKVDVHQLMKNAFTWSQGLGRAQTARMKEIKDGQSHTLAPPRFLLDVRDALWQGNALALEANERGDCWLLDHSGNAKKSPEHHLLEQHANGVRLVFHKKRLVVERSDVQGPHAFEIGAPHNDGSRDITASPLLFHLAAHQLRQQGISTHDVMTKSANHWQLPREASPHILASVAAASRYLYRLGKNTGSQRQTSSRMQLSADGLQVEIAFAKHALLERPRLYHELMQLHRELAHTDADAMIRDVHVNMIDPREADPRRDDLHHMAHITRAQQPTLEALAGSLTSYLKLLGGAEYTQDASYNLSRELKTELATLGLLLHEMASLEKRTSMASDALVVRSDIHTTQEKLSNVAYGGDQLREALVVARQAIAGSAAGDGGLLREVGNAMATTMDTVATQAYHRNRSANLPQAMASYRAQTIALLGTKGEEAFQHAAYLAAMRYLVRGARDPAHHPLELKVADYLLGEAYPGMTHKQREAITYLYRDGRHDPTVESLYANFATTQKKRNVAHSPLQKKMAKSGADYFLQQYTLLIEQHGTLLAEAAWLKLNPAVSETIEKRIRSAYYQSAGHYLKMARIEELDALTAQPNMLHDYEHDAVMCYQYAGLSQEKIDSLIASSHRKKFSAEEKENIRVQVAAKGNHLDMVDGLSAAIFQNDNAQRLRAMLINQHYEHYIREAIQMGEDFYESAAMNKRLYRLKLTGDTRLSGGISDMYATHKGRKALLATIEKTLKETHDLLMVKYHHVRDIQGLLVLLSQQASMVASITEEDQASIETMGKRIAHKPEMVGIHDQTLANVNGALDETSSRVYEHFLQTFTEQDVATRTSLDADGGVIHVALRDIEQLFDRWQQREEKRKPVCGPKTVSPHLHSWLARVAGKLFLQPSIVQQIQSLRHDDAALYCEVTLAPDLDTRRTEWAALRKVVYGLGIAMPPMPLDTTDTYTLRLPLASRTKRREERLGVASDALKSFAVAEGMAPRAAQSMVARALENAREPGALARALARAGDRADAVRKALER